PAHRVGPHGHGTAADHGTDRLRLRHQQPHVRRGLRGDPRARGRTRSARDRRRPVDAPGHPVGLRGAPASARHQPLRGPAARPADGEPRRGALDHAAALPPHRTRIDPAQGLTPGPYRHTLTDMTASTRRIGSLTVSSLGLGAMPLSMGRGEPAPHDLAMATIHAALDAGITQLDTADIYAPSGETMGHNETFVGEARRSWDGDRSQLV